MREVWNGRSSDWVRQTRSDPYRLRQDALVDVIRRHVTPCRALDVGCGLGNLSMDLHGHGFDVYATDLSENMIDQALQTARGRIPRAEERFKVMDKGHIPFHGLFDLITAIGVFPYVPDYRGFLGRLAERLAPDGLLVASNTNRVSLFGAGQLIRRLLRPGFSRAWWGQTFALAYTGLWSGGYLDFRAARQVYSARAFDALLAEAGFRRIDSIDIFNLPRLDRRQSERGPVQSWCARRFGWVHRGFYRRASVPLESAGGVSS